MPRGRRRRRRRFPCRRPERPRRRRRSPNPRQRRERRLRHDLQPINTVLSAYYDRINELSQRDEEIFGVPTGLIDLDHLLGGLQKSDLLIIAGRPGMGKTGFLLSIAKNAAQRHKKHVAIFSLEMSNEQLVQRLMAQETGIDSQRLRPVCRLGGPLYGALGEFIPQPAIAQTPKSVMPHR